MFYYYKQKLFKNKCLVEDIGIDEIFQENFHYKLESGKNKSHKED